MLHRILDRADRIRCRVEQACDAVFTPRYNPFNHLGGIVLFLMAVILVTGIYLFLFYSVNADRAYASVDYLTREQWYLGGIMRSLHRYASDGALLAILLHFLRQLVSRRVTGHRWVAWVSGLGLLGVVFVEGITGYWMVWDQVAQMVALKTTRFLDVLPLFGEPLTRAFLVDEGVTNLFFFIMLFLHLALPVGLLLLFWVHTTRVSRPAYWPPGLLAWGLLAVLLGLALIKPAVSAPPADLRHLPTTLGLDWFYLFFYPLMDLVGPGPLWLWLAGAAAALVAVPWALREPARAKARVTLRLCNGCAQCYKDCPYEAIFMRPRSDGRPYPAEPVVLPARCASCGICVGSCDPMGIVLPDRSPRQVRREMAAALAAPSGDLPKILLVTCAWGVVPGKELLRDMPHVRSLQLPCIGMIHPLLLERAFKAGAQGVFIAGCRMGDCHYREGNRWLEARLNRTRDPKLRPHVDPGRIRVAWLHKAQGPALRRALREFTDALSERAGKPSRMEAVHV